MKNIAKSFIISKNVIYQVGEKRRYKKGGIYLNPSFKGGIHINEHKDTAGCAIERMPAPSVVKISLAQHSGAPLRATVKAGDHVNIGQPIAESDASIWCPVHASVSGTVKAVERIADAGRAAPVEAVVIENDFLDTLDPSLTPPPSVDELTGEQIVEIVRAAGIVGMGGAVFPSYAKIKNSTGKAKTLLVNAAECEPYITADHRLMLERPEEFLGGIDLLMRAMGVDNTIIAIEDNKKDAAALLREHMGERKNVEVRLLKTKYPQGEKSQIIYALTRREPTHGVRLADIGFVIFNAGTCAAIYRACTRGEALTERIVTVSGDCIGTPKNVLARIGTPIKEVIEFCGGLRETPKKVINGGPMMGAAQWNMEGVITKATSALLFLSDREEHRNALPPTCIRCGRCVAHCPMHLMPNYLAKLAQAKKYAECEDYHIGDCMECGTCSYVCPGHMEIIQYIRVAKGALRARR